MWSISWELSEFLSCESGVKEVMQMFGMAKWEVVEVVRSLATREACPSWIKFSLKKSAGRILFKVWGFLHSLC